MKNSTIYGCALILGTIFMFLTMITHPTGADVMPGNSNALHAIQVNVFAHSLAIASLPLMTFGFFGVSQKLRMERPLNQFSMIAYILNVIASMCAAVFSGFGATGLAKMMMKNEDESAQIILQTVYRYNGIMNQGFAKVLVTALTVAVIGWSIGLLRLKGLARIAGIFGLTISIISLTAFFLNLLRLDVQGFGLFVFAQSVWTILVAVWLIKSKENS